MGFFSKKKEYPVLGEADPAAFNMRSCMEQLEGIAKDIADPLEVVPIKDSAYVFFGKPPKMFGLVWVHDGKVNNFKTLASEKGLSDTALQTLSGQLREAYLKHDSEPKYSASIAGKKVVVIASEGLGQDIKNIMANIGV